MLRGRFFAGMVMITVLGAAFAFSGCEDRSSVRDTTNTQIRALSADREKVLRQAVGNYIGTVTMNSGNVYDCIVSLWIIDEPVRSQNQDNPSDTYVVKKLVGSINFPGIMPADKSKTDPYGPVWKSKTTGDKNRDPQEILGPFQGTRKAIVNFAQYEESSGTLLLPYAVSNYPAGDEGEFSGQLFRGVFSGDWYSKFGGGYIGRFSLRKQER